MAFYTDIRDGFASDLITKFGRVATLRKEVITYVAATGVGTSAPSDTTVYGIQVTYLREQMAERGINRTLIEKVHVGFIISAKETAAAGVVPDINDKFLIGSVTHQVLWMEAVEPGGVAVIYKLALARA